MKNNARFAAFNAVKRILSGGYSNLISFGNDLSETDRGFAERIALGTVERKITLEYIISRFVNKAPKADVSVLLATGVYQIFYMDKVPDNAACDETVSIAHKLYGKNTAGFVNAVLRNICRNKNEIITDIENAEGYIKYSVNKELFELIDSQYPDASGRIFDAFFGSPKTFLRVNTIKTDAETVARQVDGTVIGQSTVLCNNVQKAISLLEKGLFFIQGAASQKAVALLDAKSGDRIIDVCACPGGKSIGAAIDMKNEGEVFSFDLHSSKLPLIKSTAERLGISIISTAQHDAKAPLEEFIETADRVICDVPCSGTGVMGSKPEIKYKSPSDFCGLYDTQRAIIQSASKYLKKGGIMVYSTCSLNKKENEEIVHSFLADNKDFSLVEEHTLLPFEQHGEGFYIAKIMRENHNEI